MNIKIGRPASLLAGRLKIAKTQYIRGAIYKKLLQAENLSDIIQNMDRAFLRLRRYMQKRRYKVKRIHKSWVGFGTGLRAVLSDLFVVLQIGLFLALYAFACYKVPVIFYVSLGLTALTAIYVLASVPDIQSKISWVIFLLLSCGSGFYIFVL